MVVSNWFTLTAHINASRYDLFAMVNTSHGSTTNKKHEDLDLGLRAVSRMNFSDIVTLPKIFSKNFLGNNRQVRMKLSHEGTLVLTPVHKETGGEQ